MAKSQPINPSIKKKKFSIFLKILSAFILISVIPVAISGFLTVSTYQEIFNKYINSQEKEVFADFSILDPGSEDISLTERNVRIQVGLIIFLVVILSTFVSILLSRSFLRPLRELVEGTKSISAGNLDFKIKIESSDEIADLAQSFNQMTSNLKESRMKLEAQRDQLNKNLKILAKRELEISETNVQLKLARDKTESIVTNLTNGIIVLDRGMRVTNLNPMAEEILGLSKASVLNKKISEHPKEKNLQNLAKIIYPEGKQKNKKNYEITIPEPLELVLQVTTTPVLDAKGRTLGTMKIMHDITREKTIDRMKSEFISIAAHQLRTPLSAIKWTLKMLMDGDVGSISEEQKKFIGRGYESNERMIHLVNDLLNVSRIEEGRFRYEFSESAIDTIIKEIIDELRHKIDKNDIKVTIKKDPTILPKLILDTSKIRLAIENLLDNAVRYSPPGGKLIIILQKEDDHLLCSIQDSGVGIPKKQQPRVFTKFMRGDNVVRMQTEGTGLGLFIVKNIIERHKGKIWFESEEGKGTTFFFTLPLAQKKS